MEKLLTVSEVAEIFRVRVETVRKWINYSDNFIVPIIRGRKYYFTEEMVVEYIKEKRKLSAEMSNKQRRDYMRRSDGFIEFNKERKRNKRTEMKS